MGAKMLLDWIKQHVLQPTEHAFGINTPGHGSIYNATVQPNATANYQNYIAPMIVNKQSNEVGNLTVQQNKELQQARNSGLRGQALRDFIGKQNVTSNNASNTLKTSVSKLPTNQQILANSVILGTTVAPFVGTGLKLANIGTSEFATQAAAADARAMAARSLGGRIASKTLTSLPESAMVGGVFNAAQGVQSGEPVSSIPKNFVTGAGAGAAFSPLLATGGEAANAVIKSFKNSAVVDPLTGKTSRKGFAKLPGGEPKPPVTPENPVQATTGVNNPISADISQVKSDIPQLDQKLPTKLETPVQTNIDSTKLNQSSQDYITSQVKAQESAAKKESAAKIDKGGVIQQDQSAIADIKRKLVDSTAPIEDVLYQAKKQGVNITPSMDIHNQIDRVYRSRELAGQFAKDNGLVDAIRQAPDINALDQYLIAKHAPEVGTITGRNAAKDAQLVKDLAPTYEPIAQKVNSYGQKLLDYATQTGLVSPNTAAALKVKYPNYVPLNRIFSELEKTSPVVGRSGVASLRKQTVVQTLKGSERAIQNPTESLLTKTLDAFNQGERNVAGSQLASYKDLPAFQGLIRELKSGETATHTFSYLDNGVKKTFETTPEIAAAAELLDKRQIGFIGQIIAAPVRVARVGITGLNIPFIASNIAKDQVSAFINSDKALQTSIANPMVFLKSACEAIGHGQEYDNWIRSGGGGTSFDISRSAPNVSVAQIRSGRSLVSNIAYKVTHPGELFRTAENVVARGEELTRLQQFIGTRDTLLKQGMSEADANILAAKQSREATVNFARSGDWGKALNSTFLYINAGIQGSRTLVRSLVQRPVQTVAKIGLTVLTPIAVVTAWNLSDPQRKAAYDDIKDFEKENNLVIIPPNPTKDPKTGKWNVIKIPYSQEIANLTVPMRKSIEALQGYDAPGFADFAKAIIGSTTSLNVQDQNQLVGQFTPQAVKPALAAVMNKNLFTGQDIVPNSMANLPTNQQVRPNTSGTTRIIGNATNTSPLKVEQFIKDTFGGLGSQVLNTSDTALASAGVIPKDQIGGQSIVAGVKSRFSQATGGQEASTIYDQINQIKGMTTARNKQIEQQLMSGDTSGLTGLTNQQKAALIRTAKSNQLQSTLSPTEQAIFGTTDQQKNAILQTHPELATTVAKVSALEDTLNTGTTKSTFGSISTKPVAIKGLPKVKKAKKGKLYKAKTTKLPKPKTMKLGVSNGAKPKTGKVTLRRVKPRVSTTIRAKGGKRGLRFA